MPTLINAPSVIQAAGNKPKVIEEFIGRVNSKTERLSVAHMKSPSGWVEPGQTPDFDEYTLVLRGTLRVTSRSGVIEVSCWTGSDRPSRRMGAVQHSRARRCRVCRHLSPGILHGRRSQGRIREVGQHLSDLPRG